MYYDDKLDRLKDLFGATSVVVELDSVIVDGRRYPVVDDVIVVLEAGKYPPSVRARLSGRPDGAAETPFAEDIQFTFGEEWTRFSEILREHREEFDAYFDIVDRAALRTARVCDLGCGMGRWSWFLKDLCREQILVDFSDAIFAARRNLRDASAIFIMGDLTDLPFRNDFADVIVCLGVLHHLPVPALDQVRALARLAPRLLIYLYYDLDNRPAYFRTALRAVTTVRRALSGWRSPAAREAVTVALAAGVYVPLVWFGRIVSPIGLARFVPLAEAYRGKSFGRIKQDVYDRFFTRIEQRYSRRDILGLGDRFARITVSDGQPYWHFLCER